MESEFINVTIFGVSLICIFVLIADIIPNCIECCRLEEPQVEYTYDEYEDLI